MSLSEPLKKPYIFELTGVVQHYSWGGTRYIPNLINIENNDQKSFAEYWLGAHDKAPSTASVHDNQALLNELIKNSPDMLLGKETLDRFGPSLPYLFKVLDARDMLSIQVHPSKDQAEAGFERENKAGIALNAPNRNYKDNNHKPEVHVALTDFWMLHSFREAQEIDHLLEKTEEFASLLPVFKEGGIEALYSHIMQLPQTEIDSILNPMFNRLTPKYYNRELNKENPDYWAVLSAIKFPIEGGHRDRGIFSIYLFNLIHLKPGEATYQAAGVPHAYLQGTNMELMANSDNVLRGGLTPKHVDVPELLKTLNFKGQHPDIIRGENISKVESVYATPAPDFELSRVCIDRDNRYKSQEQHGADIWIVMEGDTDVCGKTNVINRKRGEAFFVPADLPYSVKTESTAQLYKATVPMNQ